MLQHSQNNLQPPFSTWIQILETAGIWCELKSAEQLISAYVGQLDRREKLSLDENGIFHY
jgi:hypothetical protein